MMRGHPFLLIGLSVALAAAPTTLVAQEATEPATLHCAALATESASLKAELKEMNGAAGRSAQRQADAQKATAVTALAGQAAASFVGIVGVAISEGAQEVQRAQVGNAIGNARDRMARTATLSRRIQALEAERSRRCSKEGQ